MNKKLCIADMIQIVDTRFDQDAQAYAVALNRAPERLSVHAEGEPLRFTPVRRHEVRF